MLLFGQFNYGKRGILDLTHTRLFTFNSLRVLIEGNGFETLSSEGIPAPFPLAVKNAKLAGDLIRLNASLIKLRKGFSLIKSCWWQDRGLRWNSFSSRPPHLVPVAPLRPCKT